MKKFALIMVLLVAGAMLPAFTLLRKGKNETEQQQTYRTVANNAFTYGERLEYRVHYGFITAGNIEMRVDDIPTIIDGRKTFHIDGRGKSASGFDWFFKVRDNFNTYIDSQSMLPLKFIKDQKEGDYEDSDFVLFNYKLKKYFSKKGSKEMPLDLQDVLSVAYYARTLDVKNKPVGYEFPLNVYLDNEIYTLKFRIDGRELMNTDVGKVYAIRVIPEVIDGRVFKDKNSLKIWVSDDEYKVPLRLQADLMVGSVKIDLTGYSGLKGSMNMK